jgi:hypothetical protein
METVRRWWFLLIAACAVPACFAADQAAPAQADSGVMVYGKADGDIPGWTVLADKLPGWTADCCMYARAIGVNLVMYQGEWTGKPERVIVLNVWPAKRHSLEDEVAADRKQYLQRDPAARSATFRIPHAKMTCDAIAYEGTDHFDDVVVFCDPGPATGVRISWSMTLAAGDPERKALLDGFMKVAANASYLRYQDDRPSHDAPRGSGKHTAP